MGTPARRPPVPPPVAPARTILDDVTNTARANGAEVVKLRRGAWTVLDRTLPLPVQRRARHHALVVAVGRQMTSEHAFCRESGAIVHGLRTWPVPDSVHLRVLTAVSADRPRHVVRHRGPLDPEDVVEIGGVRVLTLEALAVDCARHLHRRDALVVVDHYLAIASGADPSWRERTEQSAEAARARLLARLDRLPKGSRGIRAARAVITWATPWSESAWESHLRWVLLVWGCRGVMSQVPLRVRGRSFRADLSIPVGSRRDGSTIWLHIEFDGMGKYGATVDSTAEALHQERRRELAATRHGDRVIRFRSDEARDPAAVIMRVQESLHGFGTVRLDPVTELVQPRPRRRRAAA